jgi:hypothetical protein
MESASAFVDENIKEFGAWRGKTLASVGEIMRERKVRRVIPMMKLVDPLAARSPDSA